MVYFGFVCFAPEYKGNLPRCSRALKSWRKLNATSEGGPLLEEAVPAMVGYMFMNGMFENGNETGSRADLNGLILELLFVNMFRCL